EAMVGSPEFEVPCWAVLVCGTPLATDAGIGSWPTSDEKTNIAQAKALFKEAGYKGEKVVLLDAADTPLAHAQALVMAEKLKQADVNVDLQAMDWSTMLGRRAVKDDPATNHAGWNIFFTWAGGLAQNNPMTNIGLVTVCDKSNWFGWPCDKEMNETRLSF